jgi:hypothetical protein
MYSTKVPQQVRTPADRQGSVRTLTCGGRRGWTWCLLLFASRGSGVRVPLAPLADSRYLARSDAVSSGSPLIAGVARAADLGGIWQINFSLPPGAAWFWWVTSAASSSSSKGRVSAG